MGSNPPPDWDFEDPPEIEDPDRERIGAELSSLARFVRNTHNLPETLSGMDESDTDVILTQLDHLRDAVDAIPFEEIEAAAESRRHEEG